MYSYENNAPISITYGSFSGVGSYGETMLSSSNVVSNNTFVLPKISKFNLFGYELRSSMGWDTSPTIATGWFGRFGVSSYETKLEKEQKGILYGFAGYFVDVMNLIGTTYYAGIGINLFNIIGAEFQLENVGIGGQINFGPLIFGGNINVLGGHL